MLLENKFFLGCKYNEILMIWIFQKIYDNREQNVIVEMVDTHFAPEYILVESA